MNSSFGSRQARSNTNMTKRPPGQDHQNWQYPAGYDYQSYYAAWQNYQSQQPYYGYDQSYANYGTSYPYPPPTHYASYPPPYTPSAPSTEEPAQDSTAVAATAASVTDSQTSDQYYNSSYDSTAESSLVEDHDTPLKEAELNQLTIERSEDLFDAIDEIRWMPVGSVDQPLKTK